ncbi:MAG: hypothetical protein H7Z38_10275 [Rubrivivax sp.]|nr:hypothetical protein [Pyrinomonadaceae bacterium]
MISIILCVAAFIFAYVAGRRSLIAGLVTVFAVGYFYGIVRANVAESYSHFIFDAAVIGLYLTQLTKRGNREEERAREMLKLWVGVLIAWPFILFLVPVQDYAVQLVGLRGNVFMLPFILLGSRLRSEDVKKLALAFAALNLIAFGFACAEYIFGVERFFPQNQVTELIYKSVVDERYGNADRSEALRIPSIFTGAHAYAGMMVMTFCFIFGAWGQKVAGKPWRKNLLLASMVATITAIFMAAARSPVIILLALFVCVIVSVRLKAQAWALLLTAAIGVGWLVSSEMRFQRFLTLQDTDFITERVHWSVNESFLDLAVEYPMGNGLGGGGTSMPYFLRSQVKPPIFYMENEYARIALEQGVFGLCLWAAFIVWALTRRATRRMDEWFIGRRLVLVTCAAYFATGMIGTGMLTSIPGTALLLLGLGWVAVRQPQHAEQGATTQHAPATEPDGVALERIPARQYV